MNEKVAAFIGVMIVLATVGYALVVLGNLGSSSPPTKPPAPQTVKPYRPNKPKSSYCQSVSEQCIAGASALALDCSVKHANKNLSKELRHPLQSNECNRAARKLESNCAPGCMLDPASILTVPGDIEIVDIIGPDGQGNCLVEGQKSVQIKADCVHE